MKALTKINRIAAKSNLILVDSVFGYLVWNQIERTDKAYIIASLPVYFKQLTFNELITELENIKLKIS